MELFGRCKIQRVSDGLETACYATEWFQLELYCLILYHSQLEIQNHHRTFFEERFEEVVDTVGTVQYRQDHRDVNADQRLNHRNSFGCIHSFGYLATE